MGIRLHINYFVAKLTGNIKRLEYCIAFPNIEEGLKGMKRVKKPCIAVPIPDEIKEECGIAILCDRENLKPMLNNLEGIEILGVYRRKDGKFIESVSI